MKQYKLIGGLSCVAALVSCQSLNPTPSHTEMKKQATLLPFLKTETLVWDNAKLPTPLSLSGTSVFYELKFDINNNKQSDIEMSVCADVTHLSKPEIETYLDSIAHFSKLKEQTLYQWQKKIENHSLLKGKKPEIYLYQANYSNQHF